MSPPGAQWPWTLPGQARQCPRDAQLPRLADGAKLTPARTTSPFPKGHTLPFLLPQQSRQRAPGPSSTRDGTGAGAPTASPPSPLLPPARRSPGTHLEPTRRGTHLVGRRRASPRHCGPRHPTATPSPPRTPGWGRAFAALRTRRSSLESKPGTADNLHPSRARTQQVHLVPSRHRGPSPGQQSHSVGPTASA